MKTCLLLTTLIVGFESAFAQGNVGVGSAGLSGPYIPPPSAAVLAQEEQQSRVAFVPPDHAIFRSVNGQTYNILYAQSWKAVCGQVYQRVDNILILQTDWRQIGVPQMTYYAITNYPGNPTADTTITVLAMRNGNYDMFGTPIAFYDCGLPSSPPPPTPAQIAGAKRQAILEQERIRESQTNAFRWLLSQSTNGTASDQYDLAVHYLNGQGCETNNEQAILWLQKSAAQDSVEASNKLVSLKIQ